MVGGENKRDALVLAAYQRIAAAGFEGLRLRDVAAEAGIDHSTLHHYFRTKQDLVIAVVDYATRQFWDGQPARDLRTHLAELARLIADRPELHVVARELDLRALRDPDVRAAVEQREAGWRSALRERLAAETVAPGIDLGTAAELIIAAVKGASLSPGHAGNVLHELERLLLPAAQNGESHA